jgi:iron(II)-dependent oxidoreductase
MPDTKPDPILGHPRSIPALARLQPPTGWQTLPARPGDATGGFIVHVDPLRESPLGFALSVASGLDTNPRRLDASYLYDPVGSALFEQITDQPEYYLTRAEGRLLAAGAGEIRRVAGPGTLVELGSGAAAKTRFLLDAWCAAGPAAYVPIDIDQRGLEDACRTLRCRYPTLHIEGVAARYDRALPLLHGGGPLTVAFLGSSLGNLGWREYPGFLRMLASALAPGDHLLIGIDLVKEPEAIEAAYNDAAGVTAAFTRNLFARMNRELGTEIPADAIKHVAYYDVDRERIEIFAEACQALSIHVAPLGRTFRIAAGERILTEVSHKFRPEAAIATVERCGFRLAWRAEGDGAFGLFLFERVPIPAGHEAAGGRALREARRLLDETRARTLELVAPLTDEDLRRQHDRLMSPIAWDLGHIAHFEARWLLDGTTAAEDGLYDPLATPRAARDQLALPPTAEIQQRMRDVRRRVEDLPLESLELDGPMLFQLCAQHEAQHQETMLQAIALREDLGYHPAFVLDVPAPPGSRPIDETVLVPEGSFIMGTDDRVTAYDNERPAHVVELPAFRLDRAPTTNRGYLAFIDDGGYERRELWCDAGWAWRTETGARAPAHWRHSDGGRNGKSAADSRRGRSTWQAMVFGRLTPLYPDAPVVHLSWYEADAYARWAGGRLPTEAEWEKAAAWDPAAGGARRFPWGDEPWDPARANLNQRRLEPSPAGAYLAGRSAYGCLQMLGDVWEWTASWFDGYPGFQSFPYREYSEIFFGERYRVLRGGSFATTPSVARTTFRNWDFPDRRQIFAGVRVAYD